jgi:opacity protein-like surface antigen
MKHRLIILIISIATTMLANTAYAEWPKWQDTKIYFGAEIGGNRSEMKSGGFNPLGPHENTNDDKESGKLFSVKIGAEFMDRWRFDVGYRQYESQDYTTDSFRPPTPTFFYKSTIKSKAVMATVYYDFYKYKKIEFYGGAGVGVSRSKVSTNDTVVEGTGSETNFSWQVELGTDYSLTDSLVLNVGLRYVDLGKTKIDLQGIGGGLPAGDFTSDLSSTEMFLGLRYKF